MTALSKVLICEGAFHASYLVADWWSAFHRCDDFGGIAIRDKKTSRGLYGERIAFHNEHQNQRELSNSCWQEIGVLYPQISPVERAMISRFGIPPLPYRAEDLIFLGDDLNSGKALSWLSTLKQMKQSSTLFVFLDQLLSPEWIRLGQGRVINVHSAVLPYARGMFAIEQVAAAGDSELFMRAAGATVHYVDEGVDTGPLIEANRLCAPFAFNSIWDCKGYCFHLGFAMLIDLARRISAEQYGKPAGIVPSRDGYEFRRSSFDAATMLRAERNYLTFKMNYEDRGATSIASGQT